MTKRNDLAPCPFCGGKAITTMVIQGLDMKCGYQVSCTNFDCLMHHDGAVYNTRNEAANAWNHWIEVAKKIIKDMEETAND